MLLYTINQLQTITSSDSNIIIIYFISIILAVSVIIVKSPVVSILNLIGLFCSVAIYLVKSGLVFPGLTYLLVYVGAISILFIFIVMLLNVRISELLTETKNSTVLGIISVISIIFLFSNVIPELQIYYFTNNLTNYVDFLSSMLFSGQTVYNYEMEDNILNIASVSAKAWDVSLAETSHISSIGNIFYTKLSIQVIIIGLILLIAMIGAIVITVKNINKPINDEIYNNSNPINLNSGLIFNVIKHI